MMKKILIVGLFFLTFLIPVGFLQAAGATYFEFSPTTIDTRVNQTFEVKVNGVFSSEQVLAVDAYITYESGSVSVEEVKYGTFFPQVSSNSETAGEVYISASTNDLNLPKTGQGTVATIVFKAKSISSSKLRFRCSQGSTTDSNIIKNDENSTDIILCTNNNEAAIVITQSTEPTVTGAASQPTSSVPTPSPAAVVSSPTPLPAEPTVTLYPTAIPTAIPTSIPLSAPSELPRAGSFDYLLSYSFLGFGLLIIGIAAKILFL